MRRLFFRIVLLVGACTLLVSGCAPWGLRPQGNLKPEKAYISPALETTNRFFPGLLPYRPSETRGMLSDALERDLDISRLELGLIEIAQQTFSPDNTYFQEGQYISREEAQEWLSRKSPKHPHGLNPSEETEPRLLVHILEHDYYQVIDRKARLVGMVIGLTLHPTPRVKRPDGQPVTLELTDEALRREGKRFAAAVAERLRDKGIRDIPLVFAIYRKETQNPYLPGRFVAVGTADAGKTAITQWREVHERFVLLPSAERLDDPLMSLNRRFADYQRAIQEFFRGYVAVTGLARFEGDQLLELRIRAVAEYDSRAEAIQTIQFMANRLNGLADEDVHVTITVETVNQPLALYERPAQGEPYLHVFRY
ncbi:MAG TPA: CamS family sex pheromone protein [Calditerricola sp.]